MKALLLRLVGDANREAQAAGGFKVNQDRLDARPNDVGLIQPNGLLHDEEPAVQVSIEAQRDNLAFLRFRFRLHAGTFGRFQIFRKSMVAPQRTTR